MTNHIILRLVYQAYLFGNGLVMTILSVNSFNSFKSDWVEYNLILKNWQQPLIYDIRATNQSCDQPNEILLSYYNFPGTYAGCQCDIFTYTLRKGACTQRALNNGCSTLNSYPNINMTNFPINNNTYYKLCGTIDPTDNKNTFYSNPQRKPCNSLQLQCGTKDDYFICTNQPKCPIFDISPTNNYTDGIVDLPDGEKFYYTRSLEGQMPMVEWKIGEGSGICINNAIPSITSGRSDYALMRNLKRDCARDTRFTRLANTSEAPFYHVNQMDLLPQLINGFQIDDKYQWGIYKRGYILWKLECRDNTFQSFLNTRQNLDTIYSIQEGQTIIASVFFLVISIIMSFMVVYTICGGNWCCIKGKGTAEANRILQCEVFIKIIIQLSYAIIIIISFALVRSEYNYLDSLISKNCTDEQTTDILRNIRDNLQNEIYVNNIILLVLFIFSLFVDFGAVYFAYKNKKFSICGGGTHKEEVQVQPNQIEMNHQQERVYQNYYAEQQLQNPDDPFMKVVEQ
ncbi:hypothetical protein pb186bvf_016536 [Paramecium bursaria]